MAVPDYQTLMLPALKTLSSGAETHISEVHARVATADFTRGARDYVARSLKRIVLIDGEKLARLMVSRDIGVRMRICHQVKRIDEDYFTRDVA